MNRFDLTENMRVGDVCAPALACTTEQEAASILEDMIEYYMVRGGHSAAESLHIARSNIGYMAGHCDAETYNRTNKLFNAVSPIFGEKRLEAMEAYHAGREFVQENTDWAGRITVPEVEQSKERPFSFTDWASTSTP